MCAERRDVVPRRELALGSAPGRFVAAVPARRRELTLGPSPGRFVAAVLCGALVLLCLAAALPAAAAHAAAPRVDAMVVFRGGDVTGPRRVAVGALRVGRCSLRDGLPIGILRALRLPFATTGSCGGLYVTRVRGERARGAAGWVYKVGRRVPNVGAAAPAARLRSGQRVIWFWCRRAGSCQRTLAMAVPRTARRGGRFSVVVRGYDDYGRGARVRGAVIRYDGISARTNRRGVAVIRPRRPGRLRLVATRRGMVRSFPSVVVVR